MTEIERKALALVNEVTSGYEPWTLDDVRGGFFFKALCRAIEQHDAFRKEVSDAVEYFMDGPVGLGTARERLGRFITPKPVDPLVDAWMNAFPGNHIDDAREECAKISAAIEKRGGKIVWGEG